MLRSIAPEAPPMARMSGSAAGVATIRQYLAEGLIDELHLAIAPVLLGSGEHLLAGIDLPALGYRCAGHVPSSKATHVVLARSR
jgi:dihydrofolate reductase